MQTGTLVSVEEYLSTSYSPDCEYVEGKVLERNLGEYEYSRLQFKLAVHLGTREKAWGILAVTEQRVQVKPDRFRVPDVCVMTTGRPSGQIVTRPPFVCVEILSKEDRMTDLLGKVDDYLSFGVRYVWILDPRTRRAQVYDASGVHETRDGMLWTTDPEILVPLAELFD